MSGIEKFVKVVRKERGVLPLVPFGGEIAIGDVGVLRDGIWEPKTSTKKRLGVEPSDVRDQRDSKMVWDITSGRNIKWAVKAEGDASKLFPDAAKAKARAEITLGSSDSFVFAAQEVTMSTAHEVTHVIEAVRSAYHLRDVLPQDRRWEKDWAFIFAVGDAKGFTALIAEESDTTVAVSGEGTAGPPKQAADIALGVSVGVSTKALQKHHAEPARRHFYRAYKLDPSIFRRWDNEKEKELRGLVQMDQKQREDALGSLPVPDPDEALQEL